MREVQSQTQVQTHTYRDREGWHARSEVNVSATRVLKLTTSKVISGTGLRTSATLTGATRPGKLSRVYQTSPFSRICRCHAPA